MTKLTKWISSFIAGAGGLSVLGAAVANHIVKFPAGVQIAVAAGVGAVLSIAVLSVALVVSADLQARAMSTAAQYHARGQVAAAYESRAALTTAASAATVTALTSDLSIGLLSVTSQGFLVS